MSYPLTRDVAEQIAGAYARMAATARYRPAAPSDGMGHITVPERELDLAAEQLDYARSWHEEENSLSFRIGCANFNERAAMVYLIEAARACCGCGTFDGSRALARELAELAIAELGDGVP
jgi:hypothetical protein